jgi:hypothetical protein
MITCKCGKTIDKVPDWMQSINVEFVCNNCPNRQTKNIALIALEVEQASVASLDDPDADEEEIVEDI